MELLKEAILTEEELEFVINIFATHYNEQKKIADYTLERQREALRNDIAYKLLVQAANAAPPADRERLLKHIKEAEEEQEAKTRERIYQKARISGNIVTKMQLYKNCVLNAED